MLEERQGYRRSLFTLQGLILETIGPLSQLLEAVNDPEPSVSMDQVGDAIETAIILLANAANKTSVMRRTRILEEYNKELVPFATAQERDWTSAAPRLFGPTFLKDAADYLQQLQLIRKVKAKLTQNFRQAPPPSQRGGRQRTEAMETATLRSPGQPEEVSAFREQSPRRND